MLGGELPQLQQLGSADTDLPKKLDGALRPLAGCNTHADRQQRLAAAAARQPAGFNVDSKAWGLPNGSFPEPAGGARLQTASTLVLSPHGLAASVHALWMLTYIPYHVFHACANLLPAASWGVAHVRSGGDASSDTHSTPNGPVGATDDAHNGRHTSSVCPGATTATARPAMPPLALTPGPAHVAAAPTADETWPHPVAVPPDAAGGLLSLQAVLHEERRKARQWARGHGDPPSPAGQVQPSQT